MASVGTVGKQGETALARFGARWEIASLLQLFALSGLAVAQPVFDMLEKGAGNLVPVQPSLFDVLLLVAAILFLPPLLLWSVEMLVGLVSARACRTVHAVFAGAIVTVFSLEVLRHEFGVGGRRLILGSVIGGAVGLVLVARSATFRMFLQFLALAPVVFGAILMVSPSLQTLVDRGKTSVAVVHVKHQPRVVMIVMDELPLSSLLDGTGKVDAQLFPHFAELAGSATWYRNDTTVSPATTHAVPAILTGRYSASQSAIPTAADYPDNVFTFAADAGYRMNVHETATTLCPRQICRRAGSASGDQGFIGLAKNAWDLWKGFVDPTPSPVENLDLKGVTDDALGAGKTFVASLRQSSKPTFDFLHLVMPHQPWHYFGAGRDTGNPAFNEGRSATGWTNQWAADVGRQRHLLQLQAADWVVGETLDRLHSIGAYDKSLIVLTADHGVSFMAGEPVRGISKANAENVLWTPLFIKEPQQTAPVVDDGTARSIDIVPTIAGELGAKIPWAVDGRSLLEARPAREAVTFFPGTEVWLHNKITPRSGSKSVRFSRTVGFSDLLQRRGWPATDSSTLRLYRLGPDAALIGEPAAPLVQNGTSAGTANLDNAATFDAVDPNARLAPWAYVSGHVAGAKDGERFALAVNGVVAAVFQTGTSAQGAAGRFWGNVVPSSVRAGANELRLYRIGSTGRLELVSLQH